MDVNVKVKQELFELEKPKETKKLIHDVSGSVPVVELSSSDSDDSEDCDDLNDIIDIILGKEGKRSVVPDGVEGGVLKKQRLGNVGVVVPVGFLDPLPPVEQSPVLLPLPPSLPQLSSAGNENAARQNYKQFWKAGDYEGASPGVSDSNTVGMDHVRVHPKFLHSNATSHKWALGAFAELLDNALDEIHSGATYVNIDMLQNKKDGNRMLLIEDNGGGMDPDKMRQCMSLGYSVKSKLANTIGQYGNGFKTSTMRLGADVIVFSRCCGKGGKSPTQSIGLLSYTYLRSTGKEDIVVPMLDYERGRGEWNKMIRLTPDDWNKNVEPMVQWSPFSNEADLLRQFNLMKDHGTRIIIYNLWEDDLGMLELDFDTDKHDILLRGVNRDEKNIQMAKKFPNSRHFLTYRHSLRSYASILYLRLAPGFRIILRRKDVEHHNIVNDMMLTQEITYRPQPGSDGIPKDSNMLAIVTIGFVKDAKNHIDVQGFNVYHKNRLIKPFWRLWNAAGSEGRGAIGVLEANFVEPAHDKQGFERTTVLSRLEAKLLQMQKTYWYTYCQKIGYAPRRKEKLDESYGAKNKGIPSSSRRPNSDLDKSYTCSNQSQGEINLGKSDKSLDGKYGNGRMSSKKKNGLKTPGKRSSLSEASSPSSEDNSDDGIQVPLPERRINGSNKKAVIVKKSYEKNGTSTIRSSSNLENSEAWQDCGSSGMHIRASRSLQAKGGDSNENEHSVTHSNTNTIDQLREENHKFRERLKKKEDEISKDLLIDLQHERERCKSLKTQVQEAQQKIEVMNREQESLIDIFLKERDQRDIEEENLRKKLKDASNTIQELMDKVSQMKSPN